jgi:hypothetical protein
MRAIEVSTILLEVLLRIGKIGLTLFEERFRLLEGEPETEELFQAGESAGTSTRSRGAPLRRR